MSARDDVIDALVQFDKSNTSMKTLLRELQTASTDTSYYQTRMHLLPLDVIKRRNTIDYLLTRFLGTEKMQKLDLREKNTLRLLLYETKWLDSDMDDIISLYPRIKSSHLKAIMCAIEANLDALFDNLAPVNKLSLMYSHPTFLVKTLLDNLPLDETILLLKTNNQSRTYYIRLNQLLSKDTSILDSIEGVKIEGDSDVRGLYRVVDGIEKIISSKLFQDGYLLVQDKASILAVEALDLHPGQNVWDACAAPGMKTQLIAEKLGFTGKIVATDVYRDRVKVARGRTQNLGAKQIEWVHTDATNPVITTADKILIDAPCTATGIFQSYPSFKWRLNKDTLFSLMTVQNKILDGVLSIYKKRPGTEIVFSTCSILPHEGESQIDSVLSRYNVELLDPIHSGSRGYLGFKCSNQVTRLFPHKHKTSGFFIARLRVMP